MVNTRSYSFNEIIFPIFKVLCVDNSEGCVCVKYENLDLFLKTAGEAVVHSNWLGVKMTSLHLNLDHLTPLDKRVTHTYFG